MKRGLLLVAVVAAVALWFAPAMAGEYHVGGTLLCYDCHTMHFSMEHGFAGGTVTKSGAGVAGGDWLGSTGPNTYLLKAPANQLCLACHDGQTFAPDVVGENGNLANVALREAGGLNHDGATGNYAAYKGHSLDSTAVPPGFDPGLVGLSANYQYNASNGLECTSCHLQHGTATAYRNLGPRGQANFQPTYVVSTTPPASGNADVWVNMSQSWVSGSTAPGASGGWDYYSQDKVFFNRTDQAGLLNGAIDSSNRLGNFCSACHASFHGGPGDSTVGGSSTGSFTRHPTAMISIGTLGGGHSNLTRYQNATNRVKVWANYLGNPATGSNITNPSPGCISCHKAHGNQNPFGLIFMARSGGTVSEEGTTTTVAEGMRNLCGQCHVQGN